MLIKFKLIFLFKNLCHEFIFMHIRKKIRNRDNICDFAKPAYFCPIKSVVMTEAHPLSISTFLYFIFEKI